MADVFISYARKEIARAEIIKTALEARGLDVFFDMEGLDGGDAFPDILDREVKTCGVVLGLWSPYALSRPWVKIECRIGLDRKVLVPATIEPVPSLDMPATFYNLHCIDLTDFDGQVDHQGMKTLWRALARTLKRPDLLEQKAAPNLETPIIGAGVRIVTEPGGAAQRPSAATAQPDLSLDSPWTQSGDGATQAATQGSGASESEATGPKPIGPRVLDWLLHERNRVLIGSAIGLVLIALFVVPIVLKPKPHIGSEVAGAADNAGVTDPAASADPITDTSGSALSGARAPNAIPGDSAGVASPPAPGKTKPEAPADPRLARAEAAIAAIPTGDWRSKLTSQLLPQVLQNCTMADLQALAQTGVARAQSLVGIGFHLGLGGLPVNKPEAVRLYRLAADQGDAGAQTNLGFMYYNGEGGLPKDPVQAARLYRLAADQGDARAQYNLGVMYSKGEGGLPQDQNKAIELWRQAARGGDPNAQGSLRARGLTW